MIDNFTMTPNHVLDAACKVKLNGTQHNILNAIIRRSYGFREDKARMSISFIKDLTGRDDRQIKREIKEMEERRILTSTVRQGSTRMVSINEDTSSWIMEPTRGKSTPSKDQTSGELTPCTSGELTPSTCGESTTHINKDLKKNRKKNTTPKKFSKPTIEEIEEYCNERKNGIDPEYFFNYYESKGWVIGKSPMKSWKSSVITWEKNNFNKSATTSKPYQSKAERDEEQLNRIKRKAEGSEHIAIQNDGARSGEVIDLDKSEFSLF